MAAAVGQRVSQMPELSIDLLFLRLLVGERGQAAGAPVDDVVAAIDQPLLIQLDEHLADCPGEAFVQSEVGARPVRGAADCLELLQDGRTGLPNMLPHPLDKRIPAQVEAGEPLLGQDPLDHVLGGDAGVVGAGDPEGPATSHPLEPDEHILDGVVETVTHVQRRGDVGRRHHDHVWLPGAGGMLIGGEEPLVQPPAVELVLDCRWIVLRGERLGHALWSVTPGPPE